MKREYILSAEEKKNGEGKGGKYLEKGNIFCREEEKRRRRRRKLLRGKKYSFAEKKKNIVGKGGKYLEKEKIVAGRVDGQTDRRLDKRSSRI